MQLTNQVAQILNKEEAQGKFLYNTCTEFKKRSKKKFAEILNQWFPDWTVMICLCHWYFYIYYCFNSYFSNLFIVEICNLIHNLNSETCASSLCACIHLISKFRDHIQSTKTTVSRWKSFGMNHGFDLEISNSNSIIANSGFGLLSQQVHNQIDLEISISNMDSQCGYF